MVYYNTVCWFYPYKIGRVEEGKGGRLEGWKDGRMEGWKGGRMVGFISYKLTIVVTKYLHTLP